MKRILSAFMATALMLVPVFAEEVTLPSDDDVKKILTDQLTEVRPALLLP